MGRTEKGKQNRRQTGFDKEVMAADYLEKSGYQILHRNFYSRFGEIDLVAREGETLVFCEVKYRRDLRMGWPEEAVSPVKLQRMQQTAQFFCIRYHIPEQMSKRFDVVSILGDQIRLFRNVTGF